MDQNTHSTASRQGGQLRLTKSPILRIRMTHAPSASPGRKNVVTINNDRWIHEHQDQECGRDRGAGWRAGLMPVTAPSGRSPRDGHIALEVSPASLRGR